MIYTEDNDAVKALKQILVKIGSAIGTIEINGNVSTVYNVPDMTAFEALTPVNWSYARVIDRGDGEEAYYHYKNDGWNRI